VGRSGHAPFQFACVASFDEVKGHRYLIEACQILRDRGIGFVCHLVGDGPLRREIEEWIEQAKLDRHVRVHGAQPRPEVARILADADAAVLASYLTKQGKREGIPVALMEGMGAGLPVVASDISGIPELVEHGRTGLLFPPQNSTALADALQQLAHDPQLRECMGRAGRERVLRDFDLRTNAANLASFFLDSAPGQPSYAAPEPLSTTGRH
jgi:colanic acid/amylovoran biosynthesis glycosyltransferase